MLDKLKGLVFGLIGIVVLYGVVNFVLVGGRKLWHRGDQAKLDTLKTSLASENSRIDSLETQLKSLEADIRKSESYINSIDQYSSDYNNLVDQYNAKISRYNSLYSDYENSINQYNTHVNEANELAKKIGSTWYIVPIPGSKGAYAK